MAIQRRTLSQIRDEIYRIVGNYNLSSNVGLDAPWKSNVNLYRIINDYIQRLPIRAAQLVQSAPPRRPIRFDMWKTVTDTGVGGNLSATQGSSTVTLPSDFDEIISLYDLTNREVIHPIKDVTRFHKEIRTRAAGPPEYYEMRGTSPSTALRSIRLYPDTEASITPSLELFYWRLPARMAGSDIDNEYPDIDPKYQYLAIVGPALEILRVGDPAYERYALLEKELLTDLVISGQST